MLSEASARPDPAGRLDHLVRAFCEIASRTPRLEVGFHGTMTPAGAAVDPDRGIDIRLHCPDTGSDAVLRLMRNGAVFRAFSPARPDSDMVSLIQDHLSVYLDQGYRWGGTVFASPADLAATLFDHMNRRLAALGDGGLAAHGNAGSVVTEPAARSPWPRVRRGRPGRAVRRVPEASTGRL